MNKNSAILWLPPIIEAGIHTPKTEIVKYNHREIVGFFDGDMVDEFADLVNKVRNACDKIGYPVFIRTDLSSAKHDGPNAYRVDGELDIERVLLATISDNEMKFWLEPHPPQAILVREWLDLDSPFKAFYGHAIAREWRFFADEESVKCFHPYWPEDSIQFFGESEPENWKELLKETHTVPENIEYLKGLSIKAASLYGFYASVDMAMDLHGKWWLTDMAIAKDSYHWPTCNLIPA